MEVVPHEIGKRRVIAEDLLLFENRMVLPLLGLVGEENGCKAGSGNGEMFN